MILRVNLFVTLPPNPNSPATLPVYTSNSLTYPDTASAHTHTLKPLLTGFFGKYCFIVDLLLNAIIASSMEASRCGLYAVGNWREMWSVTGLIFTSLTWVCPEGEGGIIYKVEVAGDFDKLIPCDLVCYGPISVCWVKLPVISYCR